MTPEEFEAYIIQLPAEAEAAIKGLREKIGHVTEAHFRENFEEEGFVNASLEPWKDVKRRSDPRVRGVRATNKILAGVTGNLKRSISSEVGPGENQVTVFSDTPYASAHNEGTTSAGRGHSTTIPQRQFIGDSEKLNDRIHDKIEEEMGKVLGK